MPTNPLSQLLLCAVLVFVLWILCGPVLRKLSKPKPLPTLEDIMRADIDHAEREAYRHRREVEMHQAMEGMFRERVDGLITQLAMRTAPEAAPATVTGATGYPEPPEWVGPGGIEGLLQRGAA